MSGWDITQYTRGSEVETKTGRTRHINAEDDTFYALVTPQYCHRRKLREENIIDIVSDGPAGRISTISFVEKAHPFYPHNYSMAAIQEPEVGGAQINAESKGHTVEIVDETGFCFAPRPTVGEVIVEP